MIVITIYDQATGVILRNLSLMNPEDVSLQCDINEAYVLGSFQEETHYIENGEAVEKPPRPHPFSVFDMVTKTWIETEQALLRAKSDAKRKLGDAVSMARKRFITALPGQEMIYLAKESEARRYLALSPEPETLAEFPLIAAEVGVTAPTAYQIAQIWMFMSGLWTQAAAAIEEVRLTQGQTIDGAQTLTQISQALDTGLATLEQIQS